MKTKAVYISISSDEDVFFEQVWVSAWSLKYYNPDMQVVCLVDTETYDAILGSYRRKALECIDDIVSVDVPSKFNNRERSRWIKTKLRNLIDGDYLFIDSDTVVCGSLAEIDSMRGDILMVKDYHCSLSESYQETMLRRQLQQISGKPYLGNLYYNSGVILCRDSEKSHDFYQQWHSNWNKYLAKGVTTDQQSLNLTVEEFDCIKPLDDIYNCQLRFSIKYLHKGIILHFFNCTKPLHTSHPFFLIAEYETVKRDQGISDEYKKKILECKSLFEVNTYLTGGKEVRFRKEYADVLLYDIYNHHPFIYAFLNQSARLYLSFQRFMIRFFNR